MVLAIFRKVEIINNFQRAITRTLLEIEKHLGHENCREFNGDIVKKLKKVPKSLGFQAAKSYAFRNFGGKP